MTERIVVVGAGGFGRETLDVVEAAVRAGADFEIAGVVDSNPRNEDIERLRARQIVYLGTEAEWLPTAAGDERFIAAVGNPQIRPLIAERFEVSGLSPISVIHPRAVLGSALNLGLGVVVAAGAQVSTNVTLGNHVHLNPGCIVGHDSVLHDFVSINPGAVVSGNVTIESSTLLGAGSTVLQGRTIGQCVTVGAGACVTKNVPPGLTVVGIPARSTPGKDSATATSRK